jgi:steroid delta-isomerase-like uncharacterized protein
MATTAPTETEELADRIIEEAINRGEFTVIDEVVDSDYVLRDPAFPEAVRGPDGYKQQIQMERSAFPDLTVRVDDRVVEGDKVVTRYTLRGTHDGEFMGIAPTGNTIEVDGFIIDRFEGGKLVESDHLIDSLGLLQQLGVITLPGA